MMKALTLPLLNGRARENDGGTARLCQHTDGSQEVVQRGERHAENYRPQEIGGLVGERKAHQRNSRDLSDPDVEERYCRELI